MVIIFSLAVAIIILMVPELAHAWGPGMHVEIAANILSQAHLIAPQIRDLILAYPEAFIYGSASPDIIVGKKYAGYMYHCHNWRMGFLILHEAEDDRQRAAAYGYLVHLAADVIAHNYYIPVKTVRAYQARMLSHTYWEMRFDIGVSESAWKHLGMVTKLEIEGFDSLLECVLRKTIFSFSTNKRIFNTILMFQKMRGMRSSLKLYASKSKFEIVDENRSHYVDLAMEAAIDCLKDPKGADCFLVDPAGIKKLAYAKNLRKNMRALLKRKIMGKGQAERLVDLVRECLAIGLYRPDMDLPDVVDVL